MFKGPYNTVYYRFELLLIYAYKNGEAVLDYRFQKFEEIYSNINITIKIGLNELKCRIQNILNNLWNIFLYVLT